MIKNKLREIRLLHNLKQVNVAKALGISAQRLMGYEQNQRKIPDDLMQKISDFYGLEVSDILYIDSSTDKATPGPKQAIDDIKDTKGIALRNLRFQRELKEIPQWRLAEILGKAQSRIADWETGKVNIPIDSLIKLANFFMVSTDYLLGLTDKYIQNNDILSKEESTLLKRYRTLPPEDKKIIQRIITQALAYNNSQKGV